MRLGPILCAIAIALASGRAAAQQDRAQLAAAARKALDDLQYEEAYRLYEQLERVGGASPAELAETLQRLAEIAASIRQPELAAEQYLKLLAVVPDFRLADGAPEIFQEPLKRAVSRRGPLTALDANVVPNFGDRSLTVVIARDTLKLVASVAIGSGSAEQKQPRSAGPRFWFRVGGQDSKTVRVRLLDAFGNTLREITTARFPAVTSSGSAQPEPEPGSRPGGRTPWYSRTSVWLAAAAVVVGGAAVPLGLSARSKEDEVDRIAGASDEFTFAEYQDAVDTAENRALVTNITIGVSAALATAAVVVFFLESPDGGQGTEARQVAITPTKDGGLVVWRGSF